MSSSKGIARLFIITFFSLAAFFFYACELKAATFPNPHGNYVSETEMCGKCHSGHSGLLNAVLIEKTQRETCYTCHDGTKSNFNVRAQFGETTIGSSVYASYHPVPPEEQLCTNCHAPHLAGDSTPRLLSVGEQAYASGNQVCAVCHGEGSALPGGDMTTRFTNTAHDVSVTNPASGTQIKCARCHEPHGSPYPDLIRPTILSQEGVAKPISGNNNTACFGCHTNSTGGYSGSAVYSNTYHGTTTASIVALTTYAGTSYEATFCLNCHEPHGKTGVSYYRRAEGNTLCITCHDGDGTVRPENYSYRGIDNYNLTPHGGAESTPNSFLYNLASAGAEAWSSGGLLGAQPTPSNPGSLSDSHEKDKSVIDDTTFWVTDQASAQDEYNFQLYKFDIIKDRSTIRKLNGKWTGYGEPTTGHLTELLLWNNSTSSWEVLTSAQLSDPDNPGTLIWSKETSLLDYINDENLVYLLARAKHDGTAPTISGITTSNNTGTGIIVNWTTNETATSYVYYGTAAGSYSNWAYLDGYRTSHAVPVTGLTSDLNYYYQIRTADKLGNTRVSAESTFHTSTPPTAPTDLTGPNGTDPSSGNYVTVNFAWAVPSDPDPTDSIAGYEVSVYLNGSTTPWKTISTGTNSCSVYLDWANATHTVSWKVRAKDQHNVWSNYSTGPSFPHTGPTVWTCDNADSIYNKLKSKLIAFSPVYQEYANFVNNKPTKLAPAEFKEIAQMAVLTGHYSLNTDYVELEAWSVDPTVPDGYCGNCHNPHGRTDNSSNLIPKQLDLTQDSVCFGGGLGCHSNPANSDKGININDRFNAPNSTALSHHSVKASEQEALDTNLDCVNCHNPHMNTAEDKVVDPANRYQFFTIDKPLLDYISTDGEIYTLVKGRHDGKAPEITSAPTVLNMAANSCTIEWYTDEPSTSRVDFGTSESYGAVVQDTTNYVTRHVINLTGLVAGTNYHFKVSSSDAVGNTVNSADALLDNAYPSITSGPSVINAAGTSLGIAWATNEVSTTYVDYVDSVGHSVYGFTYATTLSGTHWLTSHQVNISGLTPGTDYTYRVRSADYRGNQTTSLNGNFRATNKPIAPALITEPNHLDGINTINVTLDWNDSTDPDGDAIAGYWPEISQNSSFSSNVQSPGNWIAGTSWTVSISNDDLATWYWRVKAKDSWGAESVWSQVYSFNHQGPDTSGGSCPIVYAWDGERYRFITDLTDSSVGLEIAPGKYKMPRSDAQIAIDGKYLKEDNGKYLLSFKDERDEIDYHDSFILKAVDHPIGTKIALNDFVREQEPYKIYTYSSNIKPVKKATYVNNPIWSSHGGPLTPPLDITQLISKTDNKAFKGSLYDDNQFTFDLGNLQNAKEIKLVIVGWNEYANPAEKKERLKKDKQGIKMAGHSLEILMPDGSWKSEKIKFQPGHPKTDVLDLTGKFPANSKKYVVRLRGMYRPYFDFVGIDITPQAKIKITELKMSGATLRYKGIAKFSEKPAPNYDYETISEATFHNGRFTKYGDVLPLLKEIDDKLVVMDSGDELLVTFKAIAPPVPGMTRSFVLVPWNYYKEGNNPTVEPIPFRKMDFSDYPESLGPYPEELQNYVQEWNTRVQKAGEKPLGFLERIAKFVTGLYDYVAKKWQEYSQKPLQEKNNKLAVSQESPYEQYLNTPYTGFNAGEEHYSLNTNYIVLRTDTLTQVTNYTMSSPGAGMWSSATEPSPSSPGSDGLSEMAKVTTDDINRWTTNLAVADGSYNYQMYKFALAEPPRDLSSFVLYWKGYGEPTAGSPVSISLWNFNTSSWVKFSEKVQGTEGSISVQQYVDYNAYCYKCHGGPPPASSGVKLGPITRNIAASYPTDEHGVTGGSQIVYDYYGYCDACGGSSHFHYESCSQGTIKSPYTRGHGQLPCIECHDLHGSQNVYHLRENPNGASPAQIAGTDYSKNAQVKAYCQSCHAGDLPQFHKGCLDCHNMVGAGHYGWDGGAPTSGDFGMACISCHTHGGYMYPHGECHCSLDYNVKTF